MQEKTYLRSIDELGRFVLPLEAQFALHAKESDVITLFVNEKDGEVILRKTKLSCFSCGSLEQINLYHQTYICQTCLNKLQA